MLSIRIRLDGKEQETQLTMAYTRQKFISVSCEINPEVDNSG